MFVDLYNPVSIAEGVLSVVEDNLLIATGQSHSVREFLEKAFEIVGLDYIKYLEIDEKVYRPAEVNVLLGDAGKAKAKLSWRPTTAFDELVKEMVTEDIKYYG